MDDSYNFAAHIDLFEAVGRALQAPQGVARLLREASWVFGESDLRDEAMAQKLFTLLVLSCGDDAKRAVIAEFPPRDDDDRGSNG